MDLKERLNMPLDYWSIVERIGEIEWPPSEIGSSDYYTEYADLFNEMGGLASGLYTELEKLVSDLEYSNLPRRRLRREEQEYPSGGAWFDAVVGILRETDMRILLENEGVYDPDDIEKERERRHKAIMALPKEKMYFLFTEVLNFVMRFMELSLAYETICGSIDELDRLNSFREHNGVPQLPQSAYV